jgi:hypothetical protein
VPPGRRVVLVALLLLLAFARDAGARLYDPVYAATSDSECFGAAALDPQRPWCRSANDVATAVPSPAEALELPNSPCQALPSQVEPPVCRFGAEAADATETVALVGDSHAAHWRAALAVVARERGWHGLSLSHSSCPLQKALRDLAEPRRTSCRRWKRQVFEWFEHHPEVTTVFVAGLTGGSGVVPAEGRSPHETAIRSYVRAWQSLPSTVRQLVVIRDTPKFRSETNRCVARAIESQRAPGRACALSRGEALDRDPAIAAARRVGSPRVRTIDLTRYFCDRRRCFPVVGGALVLRDNTHVTGTFSATLGPYLDRALRGELVP